MYIAGIQMCGNEHGQLRKDTIYASLYEEDGRLVIAATLEHILATIRDDELEVENVTVRWEKQHGVMCSTVSLFLPRTA